MPPPVRPEPAVTPVTSPSAAVLCELPSENRMSPPPSTIAGPPPMFSKKPAVAWGDLANPWTPAPVPLVVWELP